MSDPKYVTHSVLVVGYDESFDCSPDDSSDDTPHDSSVKQKYWIIKNSWGKDWGKGDYAKLQRGTADPLGICGIHQRPGIYPIGYLYPAPSMFARYMVKLVDICPLLRALVVWNIANDLQGIVMPKRIIHSFGPFILLDLLRGKNCSQAFLNSYLESHVFNFEEAAIIKSAVGHFQYGSCSWRLMSTLDSLEKNAFASATGTVYGTNVSSISCRFRVPEQISEKLGYIHPEASFGTDVDSSFMTEHNRRMAYNNDFSPALLLADKGETSKSYLHPVSETAAAAAAQLTQRFMRKESCLSAGTSSNVTHPCSLLMSRMSHSENLNGILYQHQRNTSTSYQAFPYFGYPDVAGFSSRVGLANTLGF